MFIIGGDDNKAGDNAIGRDDEIVQKVVRHARKSKSIVAHLLQVPNQPLYFKNDPRLVISGL